MNQTLPKGLKIVFLLSTIIGLIYGGAFLILPEPVGNLIGWTMTDPGYRILGAAIIGIAIATGGAYVSSTWSEVRWIVLMQIIWPLLGSISSMHGVMTQTLPTIASLNAIFGIGFTIVFGYYYYKLQFGSTK